jgi:hypothetical protein
MEAHLRSVEKQTGVRPEGLEDKIPLPIWAGDIWNMYCELSEYRESDGKIKPTEIKAWASLSGIRLSRIEFMLLMTINKTYLESQHNAE